MSPIMNATSIVNLLVNSIHKVQSEDDKKGASFNLILLSYLICSAIEQLAYARALFIEKVRDKDSYLDAVTALLER